LPTEELISVIVPAHNVARFIAGTLRSVLNQTHAALEVIVVDDGSTDETAAIAEGFARQDRRLRVIRAGHQGVSAARNRAIAEVRGNLIAPIDADDIWHVEKLARQLAAMRVSGAKTGVVYCWSAGIDESDRVILPAWNNSTAAGDVLRDIVVSGIAGNGSTPLIRKACIDAVGGYDTGLSLCEDWKFYTALAGVCEFAVVPEYLTGYRFRDESASMDCEAMEAAIAEVTAWIEQMWPNLPKSVFLDRRYTVDAYLAFLAIRQRQFGRALRLLGSAARARPRRLLTPAYLQLYVLWLAHAIGIRQYRWAFWRRPVRFDQNRPLRPEACPAAFSGGGRNAWTARR
jgi:glycosyltransferase involved in cell wall biosynthesis